MVFLWAIWRVVHNKADVLHVVLACISLPASHGLKNPIS